MVQVRQAVHAWASEIGFGLVDQTKMIVAASKLGTQYASEMLAEVRPGSIRSPSRPVWASA